MPADCPVTESQNVNLVALVEGVLFHSGKIKFVFGPGPAVNAANTSAKRTRKISEVLLMSIMPVSIRYIEKRKSPAYIKNITPRLAPYNIP